MLSRRRAVPLVLVVTVVLGGGCGEDDAPAPPPKPSQLTEAERRLLRTYEGRIKTHCDRVAQSLVNPAAAPTLRQQEEAFAAADDLVALAKRKPTAPVDVGQDVRLFVSDVTENLEGANCDPRMIGRLERGLARIPVS